MQEIKNLQGRIANLEYRQELFFYGVKPLTHLMEITHSQFDSFENLLELYVNKFKNGDKINVEDFRNSMLEIFPEYAIDDDETIFDDFVKSIIMEYKKWFTADEKPIWDDAFQFLYINDEVVNEQNVKINALYEFTKEMANLTIQEFYQKIKESNIQIDDLPLLCVSEIKTPELNNNK